MAQKKEKTAVVVPKEEQPYEVPENWLWVRLGSVYKINPKNTADDEVDVAFIPMEKISAGMFSKFEYDIQTWGKAKKGHTQFANGDVAFAKISPCFENRKSMIVENLPNGLGAGTTELIILRQPQINQKFTFWLINTDDFIQKGKRTYSGTVGQQRINMDFVKNYPIPLPPLPEQQRIVNIIESLFKDLDEAKEKLLKVKKGFGERKAALLHKAFTGELTAKWRERNGVGLDSWEEKKIGEVTENHDSKRIPLSIKERENLEKRYDYYGASGVIDKVNNYIFDGKYLLIGEDGANLVTRSKPIAFIVEGQFWVNNHAHILSSKPLIIIEFICYYINSINLQPYVTGSAQPKMTQTKMNNIPIFVPTLPEQKEIVRILDEVLIAEKEAEQKVDSVIEGIDLLKKSILARAFRGELGTNDPMEEKAF